MRKISVYAVLILLCIELIINISEARTSKSAKTKEIKVAFVYVGPVGDGGWSYSHDQGRKALEKMG
ncbi:MAG: BMP family ABC transporter substrate-binding protein, partial [Candidatus Poribacteria bacterium]